jgi:hypothetical protein
MHTEPNVLVPGKEAYFYATVKNIGTKKAESVSLRVYKESSQPFAFTEKSDFIGTLEPNQEGEAVFHFSVENDAINKEFKLDVETRGVYNNEVLVDDGVVILPVEQKSRSTSGLFVIKISLVMTTIFVIIIGFLCYQAGKRKGKFKHKK